MRRRFNKKIFYDGQVAIEYMICMMLAVVLMIGLIEVSSWTGRELTEQTKAYQSSLLTSVGHDQQDVLKQIEPRFYSGVAAEFEGIPIASNVFGDLLY